MEFREKMGAFSRKRIGQPQLGVYQNSKKSAEKRAELSVTFLLNSFRLNEIT